MVYVEAITDPNSRSPWRIEVLSSDSLSKASQVHRTELGFIPRRGQSLKPNKKKKKKENKN